MSDWRLTAEWDWVLLGDGERLHAVGSLLNEATADDDWRGDGRTLCGRGGAMFIPGVFTRMQAERCGHCCDKAGFPRGTQSPKNDDACRPLVEARLAALERDLKAGTE